jgi:RNA polymerase primary sigma factor
VLHLQNFWLLPRLFADRSRWSPTHVLLATQGEGNTYACPEPGAPLLPATRPAGSVAQQHPAAIAQGDQTQEAASKRQLTETHLELVIALAARHHRYLRHLDLPDFIQEGNIGLIRAVERYDYAHSQGHFSSYVHICIGHALADAFFTDDSVMVKKATFYRQRKAAQDRATDADAFRQQLRQLQPLSLDCPFTNDRGERRTLLEVLAFQPSAAVDEQVTEQRRAQVERLLTVLTPREQQIIRLLFGLDATVACVPTYRGVSHVLGCQSVDSLRYRALQKLRALVALPVEQQQALLEQKRQKYARLAARQKEHQA